MQPEWFADIYSLQNFLVDSNSYLFMDIFQPQKFACLPALDLINKQKYLLVVKEDSDLRLLLERSWHCNQRWKMYSSPLNIKLQTS